MKLSEAFELYAEFWVVPHIQLHKLEEEYPEFADKYIQISKFKENNFYALTFKPENPNEYFCYACLFEAEYQKDIEEVEDSLNKEGSPLGALVYRKVYG